MQINYYLKGETTLLPSELNALYELVGWNKDGRRTEESSHELLTSSPFYVQARKEEQLIGFGRLILDPYFAMIVDLITHPEERRQGVAQGILERLVAQAKERHLPIQLIDGSGVPTLYERAGFVAADPQKERVMYLNG